MHESSISVFADTQNSDIRLENTTIIGGNVINNQISGPFGSELQQLMQHCLLGALVDSNEQYDAPQCEPETRVAMVQQIDDWLRHMDGKSGSLMWLRGGAGAGKSTLAQTIAMMYKRERTLLGTFFFNKRKVNRSDGSKLILTLVLQLIIVFPAIAPLVFQQIKENPTIFTSSPEEHMRLLFVGPLNALGSISTSQSWLRQLSRFLVFGLHGMPMLGPILGDLPDEYDIFRTTPTPSQSQPTLVVIDGLDECDNVAMQSRLLRIIGTAIPKIQKPIRFLIASRPEAHIERVFQHDDAFSSFPVHHLDLSADRDAHKDIDRYLRSRFATIRRTHPFAEGLPDNWPSTRDVERLAYCSSGHFIYASTVMDFVGDSEDLPDQRLDAVLERSAPTDDPLAPLNDLYHHIFSRVKDSHLSLIQAFLGLLYLDAWRGELMPNRELLLSRGSNWTLGCETVDSILQLRRGQLAVICQPLRSLVDIGTYKNDPHPRAMRSFHASLFDFLLDPSRSGRFHIDLGLAHEVTANYIARTMLDYDHATTDALELTFHDFFFHCSHATISNDTLRTYLQTFDLRKYAVLFKNLYNAFKFLHIVSRMDIDPTGVLRLQYLHQIDGIIGPASPIAQRHITGNPICSTEQTLSFLRESANLTCANATDVIISVLSQWHPHSVLDPAAPNGHPDKDHISQLERSIILRVKRRGLPHIIRCGSLIHLAIREQLPDSKTENMLVITYDSNGRSFQTHDQVSVKKWPGMLIDHISSCQELFSKGDNAPWSVWTTWYKGGRTR